MFNLHFKTETWEANLDDNQGRIWKSMFLVMKKIWD